MQGSDLSVAPPDVPWMRRADWAKGTIHGQAGGRAAVLWVMAILWNGSMWVLLWALRDVPDRTEMFKVAVLFAALGLCLIGAAIVSSLAWFRFGSSVLELAAVPGTIGGTLHGRIRTRLRSRPHGPVQLTLSCVRRRESRRENRSGRMGETTLDSRSDLLWQGRRHVAPEELEQGPVHLSIPVLFHIPYGLEASDDSDSDDKVTWTLTAAADIPGADFNTEFMVPVFVTEASDSALTQERVDELTEAEGKATFVQPVHRGRGWVPPVVIQPTVGGGVRYTFRLAVTLKTALTVTALAVAVCGGSAALYLWLGRAGPFALVPGGVGALLALAAVVIWTFASRVVVEGGVITIRKSVLGIPRTWTIPSSDLQKVRVKRDGEDWGIWIALRSTAEVSLGASIPSRDDAKRIAAEIEQLTCARPTRP